MTSDELVQILRDESQERATKVRQARIGSLALVAGLLLGWLLMWLTVGTSPLEFLELYGAFFLVALGGVALTSRHRSALMQACGSEPKLAEYLIEALGYGDSKVAQHAETVLASALSGVTALPGGTSQKLAARLSVSRNKVFVRRSLEALSRVGSADCLLELDKLARSDAREWNEGIRALVLSATAEIRLRAAKEAINARTSLSRDPDQGKQHDGRSG